MLLKVLLAIELPGILLRGNGVTSVVLATISHTETFCHNKWILEDILKCKRLFCYISIAGAKSFACNRITRCLTAFFDCINVLCLCDDRRLSAGCNKKTIETFSRAE